MQQMNVRMVVGNLTDDPIDSSGIIPPIATDDSIDIEVAPSWRPDKVFVPNWTALSITRETGSGGRCQHYPFRRLRAHSPPRPFLPPAAAASDRGIEMLRFAPVRPTTRSLTPFWAKRLAGETLS